MFTQITGCDAQQGLTSEKKRLLLAKSVNDMRGQVDLSSEARQGNPFSRVSASSDSGLDRICHVPEAIATHHDALSTGKGLIRPPVRPLPTVQRSGFVDECWIADGCRTLVSETR
jgi:hypothetical protein